MSKSRSVPICLLALALLVGGLWAARPRDRAPSIEPSAMTTPTVSAPKDLPIAEVAANVPPSPTPQPPVAEGPTFPTLSPPAVGDNAPRIQPYVPSPVAPPSFTPMAPSAQPSSIGFGGPGIGVGGR